MPSSDPEVLPTVMLRPVLLANGLMADEIQRSTTAEWAVAEARSRRRSRVRIALRALPGSNSIASGPGPSRHAPQIWWISHISAATILRLPVWDARLDDVHLTRIGASGGRRSSGRIVHTGDLATSEVGTVSELRVTSVPRTLLDIACTESFTSTVVAADAALRRRWVTASALGDALQTTQHRRGAPAGRRALKFADGRSESAGESMTRVVMHQLGLPAPLLQVRIYSPNGTFLGQG